MWRLLILFAVVSNGSALICTRRPANTATPKSPVDENYVISITGNPETYILGQEYNVSLNAFNGHRYISFILALENENGDFSYMADLGRFELSDKIETRFSPNCINMVENTNTNPKTHMHLTWTAPSEPGSGCILIRATVLQHRDVWHMDDGGLTRRICEEIVDDVESQPTAPSLNAPCCACDEARYELTFEGVWQRNLHPKNFPERKWETRFCELVGAAHSSDYRFWESGALASEGLKQYAEHCTAKLLDREFSVNYRENKIRTIIKARGLGYPNLNSKSMASVRVDPMRHMVSFASKIEPSPDWIVGVSGLELCLRNCTWLDSKVINLYPWDVGTDAGPTYTSPDQPQVPPDVIRRMSSDFPPDDRSPFYDKEGIPMKPMAVLTIRRQRIYERRCLDEESNNDEDVPRECQTHPWSAWTECSTKCGGGMQYKRRVYKQPELSRVYNCNVPLYEERECEGEACGVAESVNNADEFEEFQLGGQKIPPYQRQAECQLSGWSAWGSCSVTCGDGFQSRYRQYITPGAEEKCQNVYSLLLQETRSCSGGTCSGNLSGEDADPNSQYDGSLNQRLQPDDYRNFEVGNLKGTNQWGQEQISHTPTMSKQFFRPQQSSYNQQSRKAPANSYEDIPRLLDVERAPFQRRPGSNDFRDSSSNNFRDLGSNNFRDSGGNNFRDSDTNNFRDPGNRFSTQNSRLRSTNRDVDDQNPYMQPNNNVHDPWLRRNNNNFRRSYDDAEDNKPDIDEYMERSCFQMIRTTPNCHNETILGNFWFYNFCNDECMLFPVDVCDRNVNKFNKLEKCEECRRPQYKQLQLQAAESQECKNILSAQRADNEFWREERIYTDPRLLNNYSNRKRD
ncbi:spondin-1 [Drosophila sulfurigaster albostrigata]|uniref:spondin-1 n=1 Tax=Drosophila sulfurigaster albostrigata TaxID=89887 RepID=UPI002D21C314|nr:spondin-1 [Drosophila sulfurigaster albostrigata]